MRNHHLGACKVFRGEAVAGPLGVSGNSVCGVIISSCARWDLGHYHRRAECPAEYVFITAAETLNIDGRLQIVRLGIQEVLDGDDSIAIRHRIPIRPGLPEHSDF